MPESPPTADFDREALRAALVRHLASAALAYGADLPLDAIERSHPKAAPTPSPVDPIPRAPEPRLEPVEELPPPSSDRPAPAPMPLELPADLDGQRRIAVQCRRCGLCETRTQVVFGEGAADARVMFVGEAPGAREDEQGRPFVGPAGQLLTRIIENAMGVSRGEVYIANVNKCRPPGNRDPAPAEVAACLPFLRAQVGAVQPAVLVALGRVAAQNLLGTDSPMSRLRGRELVYDGIPVVATWHPAYLLRNPAAKRETWEDIKRVNRLLGGPEVPGRRT